MNCTNCGTPIDENIQQETPVEETPKQEEPKQEEPKQEEPKQEASVEQAPKQEAPKYDAYGHAPHWHAPHWHIPHWHAPHEKKREGQGVFSMVLCSLFSIILSVLLMVAMVITTIRTSLTHYDCKEWIEETDFSDLTVRINEDAIEWNSDALTVSKETMMAGDHKYSDRKNNVAAEAQTMLLSEITPVINEVENTLSGYGIHVENALEAFFSGEEVPLVKYASKVAREDFGLDSLTEEHLSEFINKPVVKDFLIETLEDYRSYVIDGKDAVGLTAEKVIAYMKENEEEIVQAFYDSGYEGNITFNYEKINNNIEAPLEKISIVGIEAAYGHEVNVIKMSISQMILVVWWIFVATFVIFILLLSIHRVSNVLVYCGVPLSVTGLAMLAVALVDELLLGTSHNSIIYSFSQLLAVNFIHYGIIAIGVSILMYVIKLIVNAVRHHKQKAKA